MIVDFMRLFCQEMKEVKSLLSLHQTTAGGTDLPMQFPESAADMTIDANTAVEYPLTINRILKFLSCDCPDGIMVEIWRDGQRLCWFADDSGSMIFAGGVYISELRIVVRNTTNYPLRWSVRMNFSG